MKSLTLSTLVAALVGFAGVPAFASGFRCESREGHKVQLYNHVNAVDGTRTPAVLVVATEAGGTLLVAKGADITKRNLPSVTQYSVKSRGMDVVLQVYFKEGRDYLEEGEQARGNLILGARGARFVSPIQCTRYKKS